MSATDIARWEGRNGPVPERRLGGLFMRVFVTGASGWVGSAVVPELINAGHEVVGLARSDQSAEALSAAGAEVHRGSLEDLESLHEGAAKSDGVIHLAFIHDFSQYEAANQADRWAIEAMGSALEGSDRPLVIASGVATTARGRPATENDPAAPDFPRSAAAAMTLALADKGVRSSVVRLAPTTHGRGDSGFVATVINIAREKGVSGYVGEGSNRWPAVHRSDAARVFRLSLEQAPAGSVWHAVAEEGIPTRSIAEVIGRHLDLPIVSIPGDRAGEHFGWMGMFWGGIDVRVSSDLTRQRLGWEPTGPLLIEDLEERHYFHTS
ncbi:MAG TPA: SDR family oxidoreductase [Acidimicrobiales bacterium]|nr:SDR family oxidoreductase [Acidimicrobiales bacterium]